MICEHDAVGISLRFSRQAFGERLGPRQLPPGNSGARAPAGRSCCVRASGNSGCCRADRTLPGTGSGDCGARTDRSCGGRAPSHPRDRRPAANRPPRATIPGSTTPGPPIFGFSLPLSRAVNRGRLRLQGADGSCARGACCPDRLPQHSCSFAWIAGRFQTSASACGEASSFHSLATSSDASQSSNSG